MNITPVGSTWQRRRFQCMAWMCAMGQVLLRCTIKRRQLRELMAKLAPCRIVMETGFGAHQWARDFQTLGHEVKLMSPRFVAPYRHGGKNDGNDEEAICEAVRRPNKRFVPAKTMEPLSVLCLHRVHRGFN